MERLENQNIYRDAIEHFGKHNQIKQAIEEMAELIQALLKLYRHPENSNVEEEIADVKIMIRQLELLFDKDIIDSWEQVKLKRLENLIGGR